MTTTPQHELTPRGEIMDPYGRFSTLRKAGITAIMGINILIVAIGMQAYLSALPELAEDFDTTEEIINDCLAGFNIMCGLSPLLLSPLSTYYGRRFGLTLCAIFFCTGSIGVGFSRTLPAFAGTLILQGAGTIPAWSIGAAVIGDLYPPERRGRGVAFFYVLGTLGIAIAPALTGLFTIYSPSSWRGMLYFLTAMGFVVLVLQTLFVPDTAHIHTPFARARWILSEHEYMSDKEGNVNRSRLVVLAPISMKLIWKTWTWQAINPWICIRTLGNPVILSIAIYSSIIQFGAYTLTIPLSVTLAPRYHITNAALVGALYLPFGLGDFLGGLVSGWISDKTLIYYTKKRAATLPMITSPSATNGEQAARTSINEIEHSYTRPEDRLRTIWIGGLLLLPGSLIGSGWLLETGAGGLVPLVIMIFFTGFGMILALVISNTFMLDIAGNQKAEAMSAALCMRLLFTAGTSASVIPLIKATSIGKANTIAAGITVAGYGLIIATVNIAKRERHRRRVGVDCTTNTPATPISKDEDVQITPATPLVNHSNSLSREVPKESITSTLLAIPEGDDQAIKPAAIPAVAGL